ncbi:hypothetical protein [Gimesia panareensis]|uniref:hypothetical protein n=1 Tax=Gimesia panareensis TaxID=2527978 RepID=UPI00118D2C24|nr:hypothetical protein [Gimesia panareensis]QDU51653.1 hypothetical protein Pan110_40200 [Gimesia panareensis]
MLNNEAPRLFHKLEVYLKTHPFLVELTAAISLGLLLGGIGFAAGFYLFSLESALLLSLAGLVIGGGLGYFLSQLFLFTLLSLGLFLAPSLNWSLPVTALSAFVLAMVQSFRKQYSFSDGLISFIVYWFLLLLVFETGYRLVCSIRQKKKSAENE